jgi:hypothetical protein
MGVPPASAGAAIGWEDAMAALCVVRRWVERGKIC